MPLLQWFRMREMILSHFSDTKIPKMRTIAQRQDAVGWGKPDGLWVSVDGADDWPAWCKAEQFRETEKQKHYRVTLAENHNVIILRDEKAVREFNTEYYRPHKVGNLDLGCIDWQIVSKHARGVIIAPYIWALRLDKNFRWYYGWDCASGCIWGADAVESLTLLNDYQFPAKKRRRQIDVGVE